MQNATWAGALRRSINFAATILLTLAGLAACPVVEAASSSVGSLSGRINVGPTGQSSYSIPLPAPGGAGGLAPHLSLIYASGSGPGLLGWNMTIGGLSTITRCGANPAFEDPFAAPISLTTADRFCLDGNELTLYGGGPYGADGVR